MSRDALVVGINTYSHLPALTAPANDAEAIAKLLEEYGDFKVKRLPEVQKPGETISVGKLTRVSRSQLKKALEDLFNPGSGYPSTAVLYFAGHGLREGGSAPSGYLATSEANLNQEIYGISLKWLRDLLQVSPVKQQVIWLDCCYSGELLNFDDADPGYRGQGKDRCFIAASRAFELAYEQVGHGALTEFLLKGLDPREYSGKWITNYSLVNFLDTQLQGTPQHPIFANSGESIKLTHKLTQLTQWKSTEPDLIPPVAAPCPYKGLQHFDCNDEDAKYFFGRTDLTDQLLNHIRQHNFLAVTGASGSGKSSLVRAGLLYQLKLGVRLSGSNQWDTRIFNPGENPLENLAKAFVEPNLPMIDRAKQFVNAKDLISIGANGLAQIVQAANDRMVLVVDQFEEVFTQCQNNIERQQFFECLLGALERSTNKLCLILVMRSDFFGKCTEKDYAGLARKIQSHLVTVTPMNEQELRQVITEPAKQVGLRVEPELVQQMIADVKDSPGRLPLLEYTLARLWERCGGRQLLLTTYIDLGSVMGTLQKRADKVYEGLSGDEEKLGDEKQIAKQIFLELVQVGDGTEHTRKRVHKQDLITSPQHETIVDQVIQKLTKENLLVTSGWSVRSGESDKVSMVELAHEALIRYWPKLLKWIEKNQDELRKRQMLEEMTDEWRKNGKKVEIEYLLQGKKLNDAEQFIRSHSEKIPLSSLAQEFVKVSQQERDRLSWEKKQITFALWGLAIALSIVVIVGIGGFWFQSLESKKQLIKVTLTNSLMETLTEVMEAISIAKGESSLEERIKLFRGIVQRTYQSPDKLSDADQQEFENLTRDVRNELVSLILKPERQRLKTLEKAITSNAMRDALDITYKILITDFGVDIDGNNEISEIEAKLLNPKLIWEIENTWRRSTGKQCGWYASNNPNENAWTDGKCQILQGSGVMHTVFKGGPQLELICQEVDKVLKTSHCQN